MLEPGDPAPAIALSDQHGDAVTVDPAAARYTVVYFYPAPTRRDVRPRPVASATSGTPLRAPTSRSSGSATTPSATSNRSPRSTTCRSRCFPTPTAGRERLRLVRRKQMFGNTFDDGVFRNTYVIDADGTIALAYEGVSPRTTRSRSSTTSTYWTADTPLASTTFLEQPADPGEKPRYLVVGDRVPLEETEPPTTMTAKPAIVSAPSQVRRAGLRPSPSLLRGRRTRRG